MDSEAVEVRQLDKLTMQFAEFAVELRYDHIPPAVNEQAKLIALSYPLTAQELEAKFFATAGMVLAETQFQAINAIIMRLEEEPNAGVIPELTVAPETGPTLRAA